MTSVKKETSNALLEYSSNIMFVRIKEGVLLSIDSMKEQYKTQEEMVGKDIYAVLVDGSNYSLVPQETRAFMAAYHPQNRIATAVVSNSNLATLMLANFYLKVNKPKITTRLFNKEKEAEEWLRYRLKKS